jgi:hypothetical protein
MRGNENLIRDSNSRISYPLFIIRITLLYFVLLKIDEKRFDILNTVTEMCCHGRVSGVQTVRRYGSRRIGYRAMYVRIGNPVVCSIDRT